jgi:hypothetical protein
MISKEQLIRERGSNCELDNHPALADDLERNHCLIHRRKRWPILDNPINLMLVASACHQYANSQEVREAFAQKQIGVYGIDAFRKWVSDCWGEGLAVEQWMRDL